MGRQSKNSFDKNFREKLSDFEKQPSELSWIAVSAHLDAERAARRKRNFWIAGVVAFILLAGGGFFTWTQLENNSSALAEFQSFPDYKLSLQQSSLLAANENPLKEQSSHSTIIEINKPIIADNSRSGIVTSPGSDIDESGSNENSGFTSDIDHNSFLDKLSKKDFNWGTTGQPDIDGNPYLLEDGALNVESFKMARVGLITGLQNGTLSGNKINNYLQDENADRSIHLRPVFGIAAAYDFRNNFGVETNVLISSAEGQQFSREGEKLDLSLNYIRIPVMAKYRMVKMVGKQNSPIAFNAKAGVQYGRMNWVNIDAVDDHFEPTDFHNNELGLVAEFAIDKYMSDDYILTFGTRGSMNSNLDNLGNFFSPNTMTNYTVGIYLQLNYGIK